MPEEPFWGTQRPYAVTAYAIVVVIALFVPMPKKVAFIVGGIPPLAFLWWPWLWVWSVPSMRYGEPASLYSVYVTGWGAFLVLIVGELYCALA